MNYLLISAAGKSSGKTAVSAGLAAALSRRGMKVAPFKKGPDYIDPMWLSQAAGRTCWNLDFFTMESDEINACFDQARQGADVVLVEGTKGLHDGVDVNGKDSNAALAHQLGLPVVLVLDARGITRGIAPLLQGTASFDTTIQIAGVILNFVASERHEKKLRAALSRYTDIPVLGAIRHDPGMVIGERHLGLVTVSEHMYGQAQIDRMAQLVEQQVDIPELLRRTVITEISPRPAVTPPPAQLTAKVRIAIAKDAAFGFYYPDDLSAFDRAGAELVPFDTLNHARLPAVDGLFIGGGFPESFISTLAANQTLQRDIRDFIENGGPSYAECGGLMYLCRSLRWHEDYGEMVGVIPADAVIEKKPVGRGYARFQPRETHPWPSVNGDDCPAHEFHYARLVSLPSDTRWASSVTRGHGIDGKHDGIVYRNLLAGFLHQRHGAANPWVDRFVDFVRHCS